jgi:hypothetical protein
LARDWRAEALEEIRSIKPRWIEKYGWSPDINAQGELENEIDLYVRFQRLEADQPTDAPPRSYLLRLRYLADFKAAGRREQFVDPEDRTREGAEYWPTNINGFNPGANPPTICLEGTYGFHSQLHRERAGERANLNRLLLEIQKCLSQ